MSSVEGVLIKFPFWASSAFRRPEICVPVVYLEIFFRTCIKDFRCCLLSHAIANSSHDIMTSYAQT